MSTTSERLEAEVWLDATHPDVTPAERRAFFRAVDEYYAENPTDDRSAHFLAELREDSREFGKIFAAIRSHGT